MSFNLTSSSLYPSASCASANLGECIFHFHFRNCRTSRIGFYIYLSLFKSFLASSAASGSYLYISFKFARSYAWRATLLLDSLICSSDNKLRWNFYCFCITAAPLAVMGCLRTLFGTSGISWRTS